MQKMLHLWYTYDAEMWQ